MMVIVKQPGVDIALAQGRLDGGQVHGQITILNKTSHLSESESEHQPCGDSRPRLSAGRSSAGSNCPVQ
ncbi:MAG: hypothetical protein ACRD3L_11230, partial [Terriglobales bacterium]